MQEYTTELAELLRDKGTDIISQLSNQDKLRMVRSKGGTSFVVRHLSEGWGKVPSGYESYNDVEDLQDRMCQVLQTCTILS